MNKEGKVFPGPNWPLGQL